MRVLVTGGAGFVGTHLCDRLRRDGHYVFVLDKARHESHDIRKPLAGLDEEFDACVHLAAIASPNVCASDPSDCWATNVFGTHNVADLCRRLGVKRIVFASSAHCYGIPPKYLPSDERAPLALHDIYTSSKISGEAILRMFHEYHHISCCALRFYNMYGPGQPDQYFIGAKIQQARAGDVTVRVPGVTKDFLWVEDGVDAIERALHSDFVEPINVGTGTETKLLDVAKQIADAFGRNLTIDTGGDPGPDRMACDWGRARRVLGWQPTVSVREGLARTIREVAA